MYLLGAFSADLGTAVNQKFQNIQDERENLKVRIKCS